MTQKIFKSSFYEKLKLLIIPMMLLTLGVGQMWGYELNWPTLYFDDMSSTTAPTTWTQAMFFYFIDYDGSGRGSMGRNMERITNTNLYYVQEGANRGNNMSGFSYGFIATKDWGWEAGDNWSSRWTYACNNFSHSGSSQTNLPYGSYLCTSTGGSNLTVTKLNSGDDGSANLKYNQTVNVVVNGNSSPSTSPAAITISSGYWTSKKAVTISSSNNITKGGSTISDTYSNAAYTATTTLTAGTPSSGYYFVGWYTAATGGSLISTSNPYTYYPREANTIYARFETRYSVTVNAGSNGSTSPTSGSTITAGYYTTGTASATANNGYYFTGWTLPSGTSAASGYSATSTPIEIHATAASKTITANFAPRWRIIGGNSSSADGSDAMGDWSETANQITSNLTANSGSTSITLEANTTYYFKVLDKSTSAYYSYNGGSKQMVYPTDDNKAWELYTDNDNSQIVTAGKGSYTFAWNNSTHMLTVDFPTSYKLTYGHGTGGSTVSASGSVSGTVATGKYVASGENVTFTQSAATGYTFKEWNTQADGNGTRLSTSTTYTISSIAADANVYAIYTPNVYTITFHLNGGNSWGDLGDAEEDGEGNVTLEVTYDQVLNSLTLPHAIKNAYHFDTWSTSSTYSSSAIWKYDYSVVPRIYHWYEYTGYVTKVGDNYIWKKASNVDLYAYYDAPTLQNLSFSPSNVVPEGDVTATITFSPVMGEPEGTYVLCYKLTTAAGVALVAQPEWTDKDDAAHTVSFTAPGSPGEYSLGIKLFPGSSSTWESAGHSYYFDGDVEDEPAASSFEVESMNTVTVFYKSGSVDLRPSTTVRATWSNPATITAPDIPGLKFDNWSFTGSAYLKSGYAATDKTVEVRATGTGTATANYSQGSLFFKDTKGWVANPETDSIYIYFYNSASGYWHTESNKPEGTGSKSDDPTYGSYFISGPHAMTLLDGTDDVYYYDGDAPAYAAVAFTKEKMKGYQFFAGKTAETKPCHVVYVNAFDDDKPMIVPVGNGALWNQKYAMYYSHDLAPLLQDWGATVRCDIDSWASTHKLKSEKMGDLSFSTKIYLDKKSYNFNWRVYQGNSPYGKAGTPTLTYSSPTSAKLVYNEGNLLVKTDLPGYYIFTITYATNTSSEVYTGAATSDGLLKNATVTITYPVKVGDHRLLYKDDNLTPHPSDFILKDTEGGEQIVSMFYDPTANPILKFQTCTDIATNKGDNVDPTTWSTSSALIMSSFSSVLTEAGVYNFTIKQDASGANPYINKVEKYDGRFYVRTDCVNSDKWNYQDSKDAHTMTYSDYSTTLATNPYSHYYVKDVDGETSNKNIRFTVATDYSEAISDTVFAGDASDTWGSETLTRLMNVRFTYDQKTNKVWRAYTEGPQLAGYMILRTKPGKGSAPYIYKSNNGVKGSQQDTLKFVDMGNWVYQLDAFADPTVYVKLTANIHNSSGTEITQYLKGVVGDGAYDEDDAVMLMGGTGDAQHMRVTYDFKTNRMMTAWIPSGTVNSELDIDADIMLLRREQEGATSITFGDNGKLKDVKTAYGVMEFRKSYINDYSLSRYERNLYWISFPFDVNLSDVFGFGKYGEHWIIEYYDGKGRAEKGYWAESEPNWKFITEEVKDEFVLKANEGYILALALSNMGESSSVWEEDRISSVHLYFPSAHEIGSLADVDEVSVEMDTVGYLCHITRDSRNIKDSYWRCIGAPSYAQSTRTGLPTTKPADWETKVPYVYTWNSINNSLDITSSSSVTFKAMHSYLVQYPDDVIVWTDVTNIPTSVARRKVEGPEASFYEWNLNLLRNGEHQDHTYVRMTNDENATENFDFGQDVSKEFNSGANIYTFVEGVQTAGNVMLIETNVTKVVPVGVKITETGEYTFAMPEGTEGIGVTLVDNIMNTRTNLGLTDYTVTLSAGTINERFSLEISPISQNPTDFEAISAQNSAVKKVMVDGVLYIVKDGKVYDARGARVQ